MIVTGEIELFSIERLAINHTFENACGSGLDPLGLSTMRKHIMKNEFRLQAAKNFKNTELGFLRIKCNLEISRYSNSKTENYLREIMVSTPLENIERRGKNQYFFNTNYNVVLTVNTSSLTVITAKLINKK